MPTPLPPTLGFVRVNCDGRQYTPEALDAAHRRLKIGCYSEAAIAALAELQARPKKRDTGLDPLRFTVPVKHRDPDAEEDLDEFDDE